ncbi:MAG TPA: CocE/NonD family hydrolase [Xanthobacteraceae bacterium]|nr:CocE/NonD family hydrolase [Xanthobacteraceae bacterium]
MSYREVSEIRDGMQIDWDMPIEMDDGLVLRADIFRPVKKGRYPVLLSYGPYGKWLHFADGYKTAWERMEEKHPDVMAGTSNKYASWEVCDPEKWVPHGYVCVRVDSRGCGRSPGYVEHFSPRETKDFYNCIEWAGKQPWSNGKVGLTGISYYAVNQWQVAALQPKHLAAMCVWEGFADFYREISHNGGIYNTFAQNWYDMQVKSVQHGLGTRGHRSRMNGDWVSGPETLTEEELGANRYDLGKEYFEHPLDDKYWKALTPDLTKIKTPLLSAANWGGQPLHPRGNYEGFMRASSKQKWLEVHGIEHWTHYYTDYGVNLQRRFFDFFLKGIKNGWDKQPRVQLNVRYPGEIFKLRHEDDWPIPRTQWTKFHLATDRQKLTREAPKGEARVTFDAMGDGVTFLTDPLKEETEICGPMAVKLHVSSSTSDADIFVVLRVFTPDMKEVTFQGALDPHTPIGQGWLRASHRKLDPKLSLPYRPYHTHDEKQPLTPGEVYELDIEIHPSGIVVPKDYRIALSIRGCDYVYPGGSGGRLSNMKNEFTGNGPFLHNDPRDRPLEIFGGRTTIHLGGGRENFVLLPIIPPKGEAKPRARRAGAKAAGRTKAVRARAPRPAARRPAGRKPARRR